MKPAIGLIVAILGASAVKPDIRLRVEPQKPEQGQQIQVQALMLNDKGEQIKVAAIYMRIVDKSDNEIYPRSVIVRNQAGFAIFISSREFPPGTYRLEVTNDPTFHRAASRSFTVEPPPFDLPPIIVPPLNAFQALGKIFRREIPGIVIPADSRLPPVLNAPVLPTLPNPDAPEPVLPEGPVRLRFKTQEDSRVCPICEPHNNDIFEEGDENMPTIPQHRNCRCFYEVVQ